MYVNTLSKNLHLPIGVIRRCISVLMNRRWVFKRFAVDQYCISLEGRRVVQTVEIEDRECNPHDDFIPVIRALHLAKTRLKLTNSAWASRSGVCIKSLANYLAGRTIPSHDALIALAVAIDEPKDYFVSLIGTEPTFNGGTHE